MDCCLCRGIARTAPRNCIPIKPPLKGEGDQRSWWRGSPAKCSFWGCHVETVRRNSLVALAVRLWLANAGCCPCLYRECWYSSVFLCRWATLFHTAFASWWRGSVKSFVNVSVTQKNPSVSLRLPAPFSREPLFPPTKLPRRGIQAAAAAVTLPFSHLKLGGKVSGDSPPP